MQTMEELVCSRLIFCALEEGYEKRVETEVWGTEPLVSSQAQSSVLG